MTMYMFINLYGYTVYMKMLRSACYMLQRLPTHLILDTIYAIIL